MFSPARRPSTAALCTALALGAAAPAHAITIGGPQFQANHALLAQDDAFAPVGRIAANTASGWASASGVYLGSGWVLTAAHVVDSASQVSFETAGGTLGASAWAVHADWKPWDIVAGNDIAILRLDGFEDVPGLVPARLHRPRNERGQQASFAGFGRTGFGDTGFNGQTTLTKRFATNKVDRIYQGNILLSDFDSDTPGFNGLGSSRPTRYEGALAPGDSGGGLFLHDHALGGWTLAGINSFGYAFDGNPNGSFGDWSGHTRVSAYTDWIDRVMAMPELGPGWVVGGTSAGLDAALSSANATTLLDHGNDPGRLETTRTGTHLVYLDPTEAQLNAASAALHTGTTLTAAGVARVPEPATAALLLTAAGAALTRRRAARTPR